MTGITKGTAPSILQRRQAAVRVMFVDLATGSAGDPEHPAQIAHALNFAQTRHET